MKPVRIPLPILEKLRKENSSLQEVQEPFSFACTPEIDLYFLDAKKVIMTGEFPSTSENSSLDIYLSRNTGSKPEIMPETEYLICGKFPDWMLVEEGRLKGVNILFTDKEGEFFSKMASRLIKKDTALPLEELLEV